MMRVFAAFSLIPASLAVGQITVDGDPAEWGGSPPASIHETAISDGVWIYAGEAGDLREFGPIPPRTNYDIVEVRMTHDSGNLYLLVEFADITVTNEVAFCFGIDRDRDPGDSNGLNFLGDDSGVSFNDGAAVHPEVIVHVHNAQDGITWAEYFDDAGSGTWYSNIGDADTFISADNDVVEARFSLTSLGITSASIISFSLVSFDNGTSSDPGGTAFNNDDDTTIDYPDIDALDGVGGMPGVSENAFTRVFNGAGPYTAAGIAPIDLSLLGEPARYAEWQVLD